MARDKSHMEQVERWAEFVKANPDGWKEEHTTFINAQFDMAARFYKNLEISEEGRAILIRLAEERKKKAMGTGTKVI
ncbi:MAG: hypothetical protein WCK90_00035 [archaeon]